MKKQETTGEKVRGFRKDRNMTQAELSGRAGISPVTLVRLEYDRHKPNLATLKCLADALVVPVEELMGDK